MLAGAPLASRPLAATGAPAVATYTLQAGTGVFVLTGDGETFSDFTPQHLTLAGGAGSFALTGAPVTLLKPTYSLAAGTGAFALSGQPTDFRGDHTLLGSPGVFTLTGASATVVQGLILAGGAPAAFHLTGTAATLTKATYTLAAGAGAFHLAFSLSAYAARRLAGGTAGFALGGVGTKLRRNHALPAAPGAFALTPSRAALSYGLTLVGQLAAFKLGAPALRLQHNRTLTAATGAFHLVGDDATAKAAPVLYGRSGTFNLHGSATLARGAVAAVPTLGLTLTGQPARLAATRRLQAAPGAFALAPIGGSMARSRRMATQPGAFRLVGDAAAPAAGRTGWAPATGVFTLVGSAALLTRSPHVLRGAPGVFALIGDGAGVHRNPELGNLTSGARWVIVSSIDSAIDVLSERPIVPGEQVVSVEPQEVTPPFTPQTYLIAGQQSMTVHHGLDYVPRVTVTNSSGVEYEADVRHGPGVVTVTLDGDLAGTLTIGG